MGYLHPQKASDFNDPGLHITLLLVNIVSKLGSCREGEGVQLTYPSLPLCGEQVKGRQ